MQPIQTTPSEPTAPRMTSSQPPAAQAAPTVPAQADRPGEQSWRGAGYGQEMQGVQQRIDGSTNRRAASQAAGIPVWGVLLILVGVIALFGNLGIGLGWIFGLALGAWFVYLGVRHMQQGLPVNWWLVGLGLLIGLGAISTGFLDKLIFPVVLVLVGLGIVGEYLLARQNRDQSQ